MQVKRHNQQQQQQWQWQWHCWWLKVVDRKNKCNVNFVILFYSEVKTRVPPYKTRKWVHFTIINKIFSSLITVRKTYFYLKFEYISQQKLRYLLKDLHKINMDSLCVTLNNVTLESENDKYCQCKLCVDEKSTIKHWIEETHSVKTMQNFIDQYQFLENKLLFK